MRISSIKLHNFRCFSSLNLNFENEKIIINGPNGSGKTSLLEALYYSCYLRSFKTHISKELIKIASPGFFLDLYVHTNFGSENLNLTVLNNQKSVKLNQKSISSFRDIFQIYKTIAITEDDLQLIQSSPQFRRNFLDYTLALLDIDYAKLLRKLRQIVDNRNALLARYNGDYESYILWTKQLFSLSQIIQNKRRELLIYLKNHVDNMLKEFTLNNLNFSISYLQAQNEYTIDSDFTNLLSKEKRFHRSLLGAHLDDFEIVFENKASRNYSSRGQQKFIMFLLKLAQAKQISNFSTDKSVIFLIDDFMTDFDENKIDYLLNLVNKLASQTIITVPTFYSSILQSKFEKSNSQIIHLDL